MSLLVDYRSPRAHAAKSEVDFGLFVALWEHQNVPCLKFKLCIKGLLHHPVWLMLVRHHISIFNKTFWIRNTNEGLKSEICIRVKIGISVIWFFFFNILNLWKLFIWPWGIINKIILNINPLLGGGNFFFFFGLNSYLSFSIKSILYWIFQWKYIA